MPILKLTEPGDAVFLTIESASRVEGEHPQIQFEGDNGDSLIVPLSSVDRQLDRLNVEGWRSLIGKKVKFSRSANKIAGRNPYWNLDLAEKGNGKASTHATNPNVPTDAEEQAELDARVNAKPEANDIIALHAKYFKHVLENYVPAALKAGVDVDLSGVSALTAQLFIDRRRSGQ
jgi:hypothetical protein